MAIETRVAQKDKLYSLLLVKRAYEKKGLEVIKDLKWAVNYAMAAMEQEDIAWVEKQVERELAD